MSAECTTNETVLSELITSLKNQKRPETIKAPVYGLYSDKTRTFLYDDAQKSYSMVEQTPNDKEVRNVKAFALSIAEELKRRENSTGAKATVNINSNGGLFIPDDDFGGYQIRFNRLNSQQWNLIKNAINKTFNHRDFLLLLQGMKPSFVPENFNDLFKCYSQLRLIGQSKLTSNPIITDNGQEQGYTCTYRLADGTDGEEHFPTGFLIKVQFAKAGEFFYYLNIDLLFTKTEDDRIMISVLCPEFENVEEQAIIDEANYIKEQTEKYEDLLVLSDF